METYSPYYYIKAGEPWILYDAVNVCGVSIEKYVDAQRKNMLKRRRVDNQKGKKYEHDETLPRDL